MKNSARLGMTSLCTPSYSADGELYAAVVYTNRRFLGHN